MSDKDRVWLLRKATRYQSGDKEYYLIWYDAQHNIHRRGGREVVLAPNNQTIATGTMEEMKAMLKLMEASNE